MKFSIAAILLSATTVLAWNQTTYPCLTESELDAQIPPCAKSCQQSALRSDGCNPYDDVSCHCLKTGYISNVLSTCLSNSTCTQSDLVGKLRPFSYSDSHANDLKHLRA